jgi:Leu/Phe-tRNA-protein transferase
MPLLNWHENHFDRVDCNARVFLTCKRNNLMELWKHSRKTFVVRIYLREILPMLVNTKRICRWRKRRARKVMTSHAIRIRDSLRCEMRSFPLSSRFTITSMKSYEIWHQSTARRGSMCLKDRKCCLYRQLENWGLKMYVWETNYNSTHVVDICFLSLLYITHP